MADLEQPQKVKFLVLKGVDWARQNLISGIVIGLIVGLSLAWWNSRSSHLYYNVGEIFPYKTDPHGFSNFQIEIANDGSLVVEDVRCEIEIEDCKILEIAASPPLLQPTTTLQPDGSKAIIEIPRLNSSNKVAVFVKADSHSRDKIRKSLTIGLQGKDASGESLALHQKPLRRFLFMAFGWVIQTAIWIWFVHWLEQRSKEKAKTEIIHHIIKDVAQAFNMTQEQVLSSLEDFLNQIKEKSSVDGPPESFDIHLEFPKKTASKEIPEDEPRKLDHQ